MRAVHRGGLSVAVVWSSIKVRIFQEARVRCFVFFFPFSFFFDRKKGIGYQVWFPDQPKWDKLWLGRLLLSPPHLGRQCCPWSHNTKTQTERLFRVHSRTTIMSLPPYVWVPY